MIAQDLVRRYGDGECAIEAVAGVSLEVPAGQFTAVMGPSGSGKSTLMHLLAGLDRPTSGSVEIADKEVAGMSDKQLTLLRRKHIGFVFQAFNLVPTLTAEENVTPCSRSPAAGGRVDRPRDRAGRPTAARTVRPSSRAGSSSAWRSPGRSRPSRPCCSRTSPRQPGLLHERRGPRPPA